ncbi:hypothetical protein CPC08DRAFT_649202 [Agrocybe pediades]|nr:hypothetical protein CPC08DRAFT_649202 [Agrocybe pediades]
MVNDFSNDKAYISTRWMLQQARAQGLIIEHVLRIVHTSSGTSHYLLILNDKRFICDCCMSINLGIPCRHYFKAWTTVKGLPFHIALVRPRWYKDPSLDLNNVPAVTQSHEILTAQSPFKFESGEKSTRSISNPLENYNSNQNNGNTPPPVTQTINAREVFYMVQSAIKPFLSSIQTEEDVNNFVAQFIAME